MKRDEIMSFTGGLFLSTGIAVLVALFGASPWLTAALQLSLAALALKQASSAT